MKREFSETRDQLSEGLYALDQMYRHEHGLALRYRWLRNHWATAGDEFWEAAKEHGLDAAVEDALNRERLKVQP